MNTLKWRGQYPLIRCLQCHSPNLTVTVRKSALRRGSPTGQGQFCRNCHHWEPLWIEQSDPEAVSHAT